MRSRAVRTLLMLLVVAAIGTAAYFYWTTLARIDASLQRASSFTHARAAAVQAAYDLRSAQQAYIAAGQNEAFWFERATRSLDSLRAAVAALGGQATTDAARASLGDVSAAADDFEARDRRVRGYVSGGQRLLASDIIFSDGLDLTSRMVSGLDAAAEHAALEIERTRTTAVREQLIAVGTAAGVAILAVLLLATGGERRTSPPEKPAVDQSLQRRDGALNLDLRPAMPPAKEPGRAARPRATPPPAQPALALEELAAVCADLARLSDAATIPAILDRTAAALDASGLVLWVADGDGRELAPIAAHGYAPNVLSRMHGLPKDSENATAAAFRTGLLQTVRGAGSSNGAIAAPLVSSAGPLGVLSLEMRHEGEKKPERQAAATIVASQLATIVGPQNARAEERNAGIN